jgi:hypothetical protein
MKFIDIINQEGTFNIVSDNKLVSANVTDLHQELVMEDNSMIIFQDVETYYNLISNADLYSMYDQEVYIDELLKYDSIEDTVSDFSYNGADVNKITEIKYNDKLIYYIQRSVVENL